MFAHPRKKSCFSWLFDSHIPDYMFLSDFGCFSWFAKSSCVSSFKLYLFVSFKWVSLWCLSTVVSWLAVDKSHDCQGDILLTADWSSLFATLFCVWMRTIKIIARMSAAELVATGPPCNTVLYGLETRMYYKSPIDLVIVTPQVLFSHWIFFWS